MDKDIKEAMSFLTDGVPPGRWAADASLRGRLLTRMGAFQLVRLRRSEEVKLCSQGGCFLVD